MYYPRCKHIERIAKSIMTCQLIHLFDVKDPRGPNVGLLHSSFYVEYVKWIRSILK